MNKLIAAVVAVGAFGLVAPAFAADLPARTYTKAPAVYSPAYNWTGFYAGLNGGYAFSGQKTTDTFRVPGSAVIISQPSSEGHGKGWIGGGQLGYNLQAANWVVGIELDGQGTGIKSSDAFAATGALAGATAVFSQKLDWFATARARAGILVTPEILFYGTGGYAAGNVKTNFTLLNVGGAASFTDSVTKGGFIVGAGVEGVIGGNWTARAEYDYLDLGKIYTGAQLSAGAPPHHDEFTSRYYQHMVRIGLNYKFGGSTVVAKY